MATSHPHHPVSASDPRPVVPRRLSAGWVAWTTRRSDHDSWRTSTAPAALSVALLAALTVAAALVLREVVQLALVFLVAG